MAVLLRAKLYSWEATFLHFSVGVGEYLKWAVEFEELLGKLPGHFDDKMDHVLIIYFFESSKINSAPKFGCIVGLRATSYVGSMAPLCDCILHKYGRDIY